MSTKIKLQPSVEILKLTENVKGNIELTKPIDLVFVNAKQAEKSVEKPAPKPIEKQDTQSQAKNVLKEVKAEISFQQPNQKAITLDVELPKVNKIEKTKLEPTKVVQMKDVQAIKAPEPPNPFNTKMISRDELKLESKKEIKPEPTKVLSAPPPPPPISNVEMTKMVSRNEVKKEQGTELEKSKLIEPKLEIKPEEPSIKIEIEKNLNKTKSNIILNKKINNEKNKTGLELPSKIIQKPQVEVSKKTEIVDIKLQTPEVIESKNDPISQSIELDIETSKIMTRESFVETNQTQSNEILNKSLKDIKLKHSHEIETLKNYLALREQDIAVMRLQVDYSKNELGKAQHTNKSLTVENENLQHQVNSLRDQLDELKSQKNKTNRNIDDEVDRYKIEIRMKAEQIRELDDKVQAAVREQDMLRERVKLDIRKIRVRERELESKLEILKRDSETLIVSRENKIVELKRKIDLLEFNYDMLQEKYEKEKQNYLDLLNKEQELAKVLKKALGLTDEVPELDVKKLKSA